MKEHFAALKKALLEERTLELNAYRSLIEERPMTDRISEGVTLYPIDFYDQHFSAFDDLVLDFRINPEQSGKLFGNNGKCQLFSAQNKEVLEGIIYRKKENEISIVVSTEEIPDWLSDGKIGLNALSDTRTYDLQLKALDELMDSTRGLAFDFYHKKMVSFPVSDFSEDPGLNESQNNAVKAIMSGGFLQVVHGPPGTGKTRTLVAAIQKLVKEGRRILVATPTNAAADHITRELIKVGLDPLRYGSSFKIDESVIHLTLSERVRKHADMQVVARLMKDSDTIRKKAFRYVRNFGKEEQEERKQLRQQLKEIRKDIREIERKLKEFSISNARVVTGTLIGLQQEELLDGSFDLVMVDEAGQALEPAIWSLARHCTQLVLAGDPFQLPPTLFTAQASKSPLSVSLIEQAMKLDHPTNLLDTQYRMNDRIMQFSNQKFYQNKLSSSPNVAQQKIARDDFEAIEFIDTAGTGFVESKDAAGGILNTEEANLICKRISTWGGSGMDICVLSPYRRQVILLKDLLKEESIKVETIDSFQGQEADIVLVSMVRSNQQAETGFLKDYRRMNVAMTRARKKLILIGDSATLGADAFYSDLLAYIEEKGSYRSAYEYFEG